MPCSNNRLTKVFNLLPSDSTLRFDALCQVRRPCTPEHSRTHRHTRTQTCKHTHTHIHAHTQTHTQMHMHTHTLMHVLFWCVQILECEGSSSELMQQVRVVIPTPHTLLCFLSSRLLLPLLVKREVPLRMACVFAQSNAFRCLCHPLLTTIVTESFVLLMCAACIVRLRRTWRGGCASGSCLSSSSAFCFTFSPKSSRKQATCAYLISHSGVNLHACSSM